jgi:hypothetical protein
MRPAQHTFAGAGRRCRLSHRYARRRPVNVSVLEPSPWHTPRKSCFTVAPVRSKACCVGGRVHPRWGRFVGVVGNDCEKVEEIIDEPSLPTELETTI